MSNITDFPVTTPYGQVPGYPLNNGFHNGIDYGAPVGTPVVVNGVTIGLSGNTGYSSGPHCHVGKWLNGVVQNPGNGGFKFDSAVVTEINQDATNGKYVRVQGDGYSWVYLHLSDNSLVKVGQVLKGSVMNNDTIEKLVSFIYRVATDVDPTPEQAGYWVERIKADQNTAFELPSALGGNDYKGDPMFRYKGRHYDEDMKTAQSVTPKVVVNNQEYVPKK